MMCRNIGKTKAKVFPLPVLAIPIKSRPEKYKTMIIKNRRDKKTSEKLRYFNVQHKHNNKSVTLLTQWYVLWSSTMYGKHF